jgi:hypothetical protein
MPLLPNAASCIIDPLKITGYLLSPFHRHGAAKAQFFTRFGFNPAKPDVLATALRWHALTHDANLSKTTAFGDLYDVVGQLQSPDSRNPFVSVVWMIRTGETAPRLVTAVPVRRSSP